MENNLTDEEALTLLKRTESARRNDADPPPTRRERLIGAIPLFAAFLLIGLTIRLSFVFDDVYQEMYSGSAPDDATAVLLNVCHVTAARPWLLTGGMFLVAWFYFALIAKRKSRMRLFAMFVAPLTMLWLFTATMLLTKPLFVLLEKIGK